MNKIIIGILAISLYIFIGCRPLREFMTWPTYVGSAKFSSLQLDYDSLKKNIFIVADNDGTEIFDLLAPYYLFKSTKRANVYIVSEKRFPIIVRKGLFLLPQLTFSEIDSIKIKPDVMVIPNLSAMDKKHQNIKIIEWIKGKYSSSVKVLSVCDGALTAAATGIYDNKLITTHATDYKSISGQFGKPKWVTNISVTQSANLYSTAGVSNAVEGSLVVIQELFGKEVLDSLKLKINYPHQNIKIDHISAAVKTNDKLLIAKKMFFYSNKKIGVLLFNGINEFKLAAILDVYNRTFPQSIETFSENNTEIISENGLTFIPTNTLLVKEFDEIHRLNTSFHLSQKKLKKVDVIDYKNSDSDYIIDNCVSRIEKLYGKKYSFVVKKLMDYN